MLLCRAGFQPAQQPERLHHKQPGRDGESIGIAGELNSCAAYPNAALTGQVNPGNTGAPSSVSAPRNTTGFWPG
jgi:hypothetical protein